MSNLAATILIVDDEIQNRKLFEVLLRPEGYRTQSVANGEEALASITQNAPDLILLDVMMPGMDGYHVASVLKANRVTANIPIIMVTAQLDSGSRLAGLNAGAEEFLTKPVDRDELWLRVRNLLRLKAYDDFLRDQSVVLEQQVKQLQVSASNLQRFRAAMDGTADAILLVNRTTMRFIEVNAQASHMLGYTLEELMQMEPAQLGESTSEELACEYDRIVAGDDGQEMKETQLRRKDGSVLKIELSRHPQRFGADWIIVNVLRDITERKEAEKRLQHLAHYDTLTGLLNRTLFYETLEKTLHQAAEHHWLVAVMFIDLDHFKNVNDTLGHAVGDELLRHFSDRLVQCVRIRDTVGRLGGDEFALILVMPDNEQGAIVVANKIRAALLEPFKLKGHDVTLTASIGITIHPADASDAETLLKYADTAMYRAKQAGRDTYRFFTAQMNEEVLARLDLETALRQAVEQSEFILYYQPKVQLNSGRIVGLEALLRWQRPGHGLVSPQDFIPALEETGLIVRVGSWVIAAACKQIGLWLNSSVGPLQISVNVSSRQFIEGNLEGDVTAALTENNVPAYLLELELTESSLLENIERTIATMQNLKKCGVQISIDDFGTGYSSLAYLRRFPIDKLKIDTAFVHDITSNPDAAAIALAIIRMAHSLKLEVVAEGVETVAQLAYLRRHHCDQIQGYYFSRPLPLLELESILRAEKCLPSQSSATVVSHATVLIVDDQEPTLTALQELLRPDGYQILCAHTAAEGFELLALHSVQVVICDPRRFDARGAAFLCQVKDIYPNTFRIALSDFFDLQSILDIINSGAIHRFYTKPWDNRVLRDNIRDAFRCCRQGYNLSVEQDSIEMDDA